MDGDKVSSSGARSSSLSFVVVQLSRERPSLQRGKFNSIYVCLGERPLMHAGDIVPHSKSSTSQDEPSLYACYALPKSSFLPTQPLVMHCDATPGHVY